jgi:anti-sigma regulatory factor (Ser/Thr protein kinase)
MTVAQEEHRVPRAMQWSWPNNPKCVTLARNQLRKYLGYWQAEELTEPGVLLLSELLTNSVRHAASPRGRDIETVFELTDSVLRIEVSDASNRLPVMHHPGESDECGRGLHLVVALSSRWGVAPRRVNGEYSSGKTVWFEIDRE